MTKAVKEQSLREWIAADIYAEWGYPESYAGYDFKDVPMKVKDKARSITQATRFIAELNRRLEKSALTDEQIDVLPLNLVSEYDLPSDSDEEQLREYQIVAAAQLKASLTIVK